jgi:hypothetical protein
VDDLKKYAKAFNVPVANFFQVIETSTGMNPNYHFYFEEDSKKDKYQVFHYQTPNPVVVITKTEERGK